MAKKKQGEALEESAVTDAEPTRAEKYRVKNTKLISHFGVLTRMTAGDVIRHAGYGDLGIARLRQSGVELEPLAA